MPSEKDPAEESAISYEPPLNHGSIPEWDSDYANKAAKLMRNIKGDNFKPKELRPKKETKKQVEEDCSQHDSDISSCDQGSILH